MPAKFKIVKALHVTARQREIIAWMLDNGATTAASKRIRAVMSDAGGTLRKIVFDGQWIVIIDINP